MRIPLPHPDLTLFPNHAILLPTEHENHPGVDRTGGAEFAFYRGALYEQTKLGWASLCNR
jgi:hypothetical protein